MKMPEKIRQGLECCSILRTNCSLCPYEATVNGDCLRGLIPDALACIEQLERERDAAVETLKQIGSCKYCKHDIVCTDRFPNCVECEKTDCACHTCAYRSNWQWRGVQEVV